MWTRDRRNKRGTSARKQKPKKNLPPQDGAIAEARAYIQQYKRRNNVCRDCGFKWPPYVLEFDHVDPKTKRFNVGNVRETPSMRALIAEIEKCDVVCANCHKMREYRRRHKKR